MGGSLARKIGHFPPRGVFSSTSLCCMNFQYPEFDRWCDQRPVAFWRCCCWQRRGHGRKRKAACRKAVERAKACVGMTRRPENAWARLPDRDLGHPGNRGTSDERRTIDADLGPVKYLATLRPSRRGSAAVVHLDRCGAARSGRGALT